MSPMLAQPSLEFLFHAEVEVAPPLVIGEIAGGVRRVVDILGGRVSGPRLSGEILRGGADWQMVRADGSTVLDARYTVRAADGGLIYVSNLGVRTGPPAVMRRLAAGEAVDPAEYYFRSTPRFETGAAAHAWMNDLVCVCSAARRTDRVLLDFYAVR